MKTERTSNIYLDGYEVELQKEDFESCNMLHVEVGTNGHHGGDSGHGCRTYFKLKDNGGTDMSCEVHYNNGRVVEISNASSIEIVLGGDTELDTFYSALKFALEVLRKHTDGVDELTPEQLRFMNFALYIDELCELFRSTGKLNGMSEIRKKYHTSHITKEQFFLCELHKVGHFVSDDFCKKLYDYVRDRKGKTPAPKFSDQ